LRWQQVSPTVSPPRTVEKPRYRQNAGNRGEMEGQEYSGTERTVRSPQNSRHNLAKDGVGGSNPLARSIQSKFLTHRSGETRLDGEAWGKQAAAIYENVIANVSPNLTPDELHGLAAILPVCSKLRSGSLPTDNAGGGSRGPLGQGLDAPPSITRNAALTPTTRAV